MNDSRRYTEQHIAALREDKADAEATLKNIADGWTFHEAIGDNPWRDATAEREAWARRIIERSDRLLAAYEGASSEG